MKNVRANYCIELVSGSSTIFHRVEDLNFNLSRIPPLALSKARQNRIFACSTTKSFEKNVLFCIYWAIVASLGLIGWEETVTIDSIFITQIKRELHHGSIGSANDLQSHQYSSYGLTAFVHHLRRCHQCSYRCLTCMIPEMATIEDCLNYERNNSHVFVRLPFVTAIASDLTA